MGEYSNIAHKKTLNLVIIFCKDKDIKVVLTPFKISNKFSYKDPLPFHLQSLIIYKFVCVNSKVCYVGETTRHFITRINEHLHKDPKFNMFKHLQESPICNNVCNTDCFPVIHRATHCEIFLEFFLVRIFPYLVRIQENTNQKKLCIWIRFTQRLLNSN